jgi:hypothetical protein
VSPRSSPSSRSSASTDALAHSASFRHEMLSLPTGARARFARSGHNVDLDCHSAADPCCRSQMNDFENMAQFILRDAPTASLLRLGLEFARSPCSPIGYDRATSTPRSAATSPWTSSRCCSRTCRPSGTSTCSSRSTGLPHLTRHQLRRRLGASLGHKDRQARRVVPLPAVLAEVLQPHNQRLGPVLDSWATYAVTSRRPVTSWHRLPHAQRPQANVRILAQAGRR